MNIFYVTDIVPGLRGHHLLNTYYVPIKHLLKTYYVPGTVIDIFTYITFHLAHTPALHGIYDLTLCR